MESQVAEDIIDNWYIVTLYEVINGEPISEVEWLISEFEDEEKYEECAGIKKALDLIEHKTIKELREEYEQIIRDRDEKQGHSRDC